MFADDEPADLAGSGADLVELAVPHDPASRVVIDVAVAAKSQRCRVQPVRPFPRSRG